MKTSLHFEAPSDLSVGTVRITGEGQTVADWIATPDNRTFRQDNLKPGIYSAEIGPAGVPPQSVVFKVQEGQANTVVLPSFSALSASGSNTSFFDHDSLRTTSEAPATIAEELFGKAELKFPHGSELMSILPVDGAEKPKKRVKLSAKSRRISIGLSEEQRDREAFDTFRGQTRMEVFPGRIEIELPADPVRDSWSGHRVRLSVAVERKRVERCLLPLYAGGTRVTATVPPLSPDDIEFSILPIDARLRALVRALDSGTSAEAAAVRDDLLGKSDSMASFESRADPWAAILSGLLAIRFSGVFTPVTTQWVELLVERAGWSYDAHIIHASHLLSEAGDVMPHLQERAVVEAIGALAAAQVAGSPYYRYTNQLLGEMVSGIDAYLEGTSHHIAPAIVDRFGRAKARWRREIPLQRGAGPTFTWLARDPVALNERRVLTPNKKSSGRLRSRDCTILLEGRVSDGQIAIFSASAPAAEEMLSPDGEGSKPFDGFGPSFPSTLAFAHPPGPPDDPNKGRFGGEAARGGYRLSAAFERGKDRNRVIVQLTVEADPSVKISLGDFAWFVLHPTFSPPMLKVAFRGNRARLRIQAWGGFTAGVWLPKGSVELECDLATIKGAPAIIHKRQPITTLA